MLRTARWLNARIVTGRSSLGRRPALARCVGEATCTCRCSVGPAGGRALLASTSHWPTAPALLALLLALGAVAAPGCRRVSQRVLHDTEGRVFDARCDRKQQCTLHQTAGPKVSDDQREVVLKTTGRLVGVCSTAPASEPKAPSDCRALACDRDQDCPPAHGIKDGNCVNGLCVEPAGTLTATDAVMLCLAGTGLGRDGPNQVARYAMAVNCGAPCVVPAPCRQP
jgi:hypothetical protein